MRLYRVARAFLTLPPEDELADSGSAIAQTPAHGMKLEKFTSGDIRVLLFWIFAALVATGVAWKYFYQALPEASVDFAISRDQALDLARQFATSQNAQLDGYQSVITFSVDEDAKTYLERTLGLAQANKLLSTQVNAWYWRIRFFRPQQKEEYRLRVSPAGKIVGYEHIVEESRAGAHLERDAAYRARLRNSCKIIFTPIFRPTNSFPKKPIPPNCRSAETGTLPGSEIIFAFPIILRVRPIASPSEYKAAISASPQNS